MRLIAIRHGETIWNTERREMGQDDSPLTARGIAQAKAIARRLSGVHIDKLYSSDLGRAYETATAIQETTSIPVHKHRGLRERNMGIFQGLTRQEMLDRHPVERKEYERVGFEYVIPGGESAKQRLERSVLTLTEIAEASIDQTVVAVTHGGFLMGFFEWVLGIGPGNGRRFRRSNASYSSFIYNGKAWALETWNDTSHLDSIGSADDPSLQTLHG